MQQFTVKKIAGPIEGGAAVFLGNEHKTFVIFVGWYEATAIIKEINKQTTLRPLTHDLLNNILLGFDIELKEVIISKILDNTFCATLALEQKILDQEGHWTGQSHLVHIDSRASDCIVLALKHNKPIWVTKDVYEKVEDVPDFPAEGKDKPWEGTDIGETEFHLPDDSSDPEIPPAE